jgi:hypothetical protein
MSSPKRRIETDVSRMKSQRCRHQSLTCKTGHEDVRAGDRVHERCEHALISRYRLMSDYEVTLVNDNSEWIRVGIAQIGIKLTD